MKLVTKEDFVGVKVVMIYFGQLITIRRDDFIGLPYRNMWDLPGGGREGIETATDCAIREVYEELSLTIRPSQIIYNQYYDSLRPAYFMVANLEKTDIDKILLGNEGTAWKLMPVDRFLTDTDTIPFLQDRLRDYLDSTNRTH